MRKTLLLLALAFSVLLFYQKEISTILPTFNATNEPAIISKGHYGQTLILEVTFSHEGFETWLEDLKAPYPLLLLDSAWIERSPSMIKIIKDKRIPTALLGHNSTDYIDNKLLEDEIALYKKHFDREPLWFMTKDYMFSEDLKQHIFSHRINMLAPTVLWHKDLSIEEGMIVSVPVHVDSSIDFEQLTLFMQQNPVVSIEENLFGYQLKTKKFPQ
ncbi:hypothetical protein [Bacillus ndiopicus]|uniref:hypothetical protein n=1 Tax=Bacillus ndiopicus TaxID=1347368 RepID=UPI0005A91681|nr:hypothetical protein [Bacillus ndiopicus]